MSHKEKWIREGSRETLERVKAVALREYQQYFSRSASGRIGFREIEMIWNTRVAPKLEEQCASNILSRDAGTEDGPDGAGTQSKEDQQGS